MKKINKIIPRVIFSLLLIISIFGTFNTLAKEIIFKVTNIEVKEKSDGVTVNNVSLNSGTITNDIVFTDKDDYIKYDITIKNNSTKDYTIKTISDDNDSTNLEYTYDDLSNVKLEAGKEKTFELTITYKTESTTANISEKKVNLSLTYEDENGNVETSEVNGASIDNPKTNDTIYIYIALGATSLIGLGITLSNKKKLSKTLIVIGISSALILPFGVSAESETLQIVFNNTIKAKEYTVSFNTNGGTSINPIKVVKGGKVTKPSDPQKDKNSFSGWFTTSGLNTQFDFDNTPITSDTEIFAKWDKIPNYTVVSGNINTTGSEICLGTECFYVIGNEGNNKVKLLAKKFLKVGSNYNENTQGYLLQYDGFSEYINGEGLEFSSSIYWLEGGDRKAKYTENDGNDNYYIYDENSTLYSYINAYVTYLQNQGFDITSGKLLSTSEAISYFNCSWNGYDSYDCVKDLSEWDQRFWLGNDEEEYYVMAASGNTISGSNVEYVYGLKPVVIMEK